MKKLLLFLFVLMLLISSNLYVFAASQLAYTVDDSIRISRDGTAAIDIKVTVLDSYAGAQFEVVLDSDISIESVVFDVGTSAGIIPPTFARGAWYFSLISGENGYSGDFTCTMTIFYEGEEPTTVTITEIQVYSVISPGKVDSQIESTDSIIQILPLNYKGPQAASTFLDFLKANLLIIIISVVALAVIIILMFRMKKNNEKLLAALAARNQIQTDTGAENKEKEHDKDKPIQDEDKPIPAPTSEHNEEDISAEIDS